MSIFQNTSPKIYKIKVNKFNGIARIALQRKKKEITLNFYGTLEILGTEKNVENQFVHLIFVLINKTKILLLD